MADGLESDAELLARFARGDARAFDRLYERHELKVWRFIQRSVRNQAIADEIMQEVWFTVARQAASYQPTARFTTWLFTLAHHRMIDNHRAERHRRALVVVGSDVPIIEELPDGEGSDPQRQAASSQQVDALLAALTQLPAEQRTAFLLQAEGELSVEDIASATGVSFETAKSRLRYAKARLREILEEHA